MFFLTEYGWIFQSYSRLFPTGWTGRQFVKCWQLRNNLTEWNSLTEWNNLTEGSYMLVAAGWLGMMLKSWSDLQIRDYGSPHGCDAGNDRLGNLLNGWQ